MCGNVQWIRSNPEGIKSFSQHLSYTAQGLFRFFFGLGGFLGRGRGEMGEVGRSVQL
jgi:hypothetical protein